MKLPLAVFCVPVSLLGWFCCPTYFSLFYPIKRYVKHALLADVLIFNVRSREFGTSVVIVAVSEVIIIITCRWGRRCCSILRRCSAWGFSRFRKWRCGLW